MGSLNNEYHFYFLAGSPENKMPLRSATIEGWL